MDHLLPSYDLVDDTSLSLGSYKDYYKDLPPQVIYLQETTKQPALSPGAGSGVNSSQFLDISQCLSTYTTASTTVEETPVAKEKASVDVGRDGVAVEASGTDARTPMMKNNSEKLDVSTTTATTMSATTTATTTPPSSLARASSNVSAKKSVLPPLEASSSACQRVQVAVRMRPLMKQDLELPVTKTAPSSPSSPRRGGSVARSNSSVTNKELDEDVRAWHVERESKSSRAVLRQKGVSRSVSGKTAFSMDCVLDEDTPTREVYQKVAQPIVQGVASGRHGTIFAYGQTGSGKTYTMQGTNVDVADSGSHSSPTDGGNDVNRRNSTRSSSNRGGCFGIIQHAAADLFDMLEKDVDTSTATVRAQYFEIYNEQVRDLLSADAANNLDVGGQGGSCKPKHSSLKKHFAATKLRQKGKKSSAGSVGQNTAPTAKTGSSSASHGVLSTAGDDSGNVVANLVDEEVTCLEDVIRLLRRGNRNRSCAATKMNMKSSRSHAIFRIILRRLPGGKPAVSESETALLEADPDSHAVFRMTVESRPKQQQSVVRYSTLNLVDLAGSENSKSAGVSGVRKRESGKINQSLLSLSRVIHALSLPDKKRPKYIGYRDSKLTHILQPHLSGNACMAVLCCVSTAGKSVEETRSTLKFADSAKRVEVKPVVNQVLDTKILLRNVQKELADTKNALLKLQNAYTRVARSGDETQPFSAKESVINSITSDSSQSSSSSASSHSGSTSSSSSLACEVRKHSEDTTGEDKRDDAGAGSGGIQARVANLDQNSPVRRTPEGRDLVVSKLREEMRKMGTLNRELKEQKYLLEEQLLSVSPPKVDDKVKGLRDEMQLLLQQCMLLKIAIIVGLILYIFGQSELVIVVSMFIWLSLEVVTNT